MGVNEAQETSINFITIAIVTVVACFIVNFIYKTIFGNDKKEAGRARVESEGDSSAQAESNADLQSVSRPLGKNKKRPHQKGKSEFNHPWLLKSLKGHPGIILHADISANGKFLAATCDDGSVILWDIRDLSMKEHKTLRVNIEFDHASFIAWSPDSKGFLVHTVRENNIAAYKIEKKKDGTIASASRSVTFDKIHEDDVVGFGISSNRKYMMSCSSKTDMIIWDLKGQPLERLDTYLMSTYSARISPCGRFVVATGFSPDVKVMEVCYNKNGDFKEVKKAFELVGHTSGIYDVAFDVDSSRIVTISKDGTWRLYHTKIDYIRGESPYVLKSGTYTQTALPPRIALSPNGEVLVVSVNSGLEVYQMITGARYTAIDNIYSGIVTHMRFEADGRFLYVCGDRAIRILHNVCGYDSAILRCRSLLESKQTSATKERLNKTIEESQEFLEKFK